MKLLIDENIPLLTVRQLKKEGFSVKYIGKENSGISDKAIIDLANLESRLIVTFDSDFGDLIFNEKIILETGIIFLRLGQFMPAEPGDILISLLNDLRIIFKGKISVITKDTVRQRTLNI